MGLFNFLKDAGESLVDMVTGNDEETNAEAAKAIRERIEAHGIKIDHLGVEVDGEKAIVRGEADSQEAKEKAILVAGNVKGIGAVEEQISVAVMTSSAADADETMAIEIASNAANQPTFYQVQKGDNLSKIAKEFYGNANRYPEIFEANKPMLSHPDKIYPGQMLRIPNSAPAENAA